MSIIHKMHYVCISSVLMTLMLLIIDVLNDSAYAETLIFEDDDVRIVGEIIDDGKNFVLKAENFSDVEVIVDLHAMSTHGCSLDVHGDSMHITSGKKASQKYALSDAINYGISQVDVLQVNVWYHKDPNDYTTSRYFYADIICDDISSDYVFEPEGILCYEDERICAYLLCRSDEYSEMEMVYYNKSDIIINAYLANTSFNDEMIMSWRFIFYAGDIMPGTYKKAMETAWYLNDEINQKGLEHIETITARMRYQEAQGGGRSIDSDEFTIIISDYVNQDSFVNDVDSSEILIDFEKTKLAEISKWVHY